jgi:hypothetical protein
MTWTSNRAWSPWRAATTGTRLVGRLPRRLSRLHDRDRRIARPRRRDPRPHPRLGTWRWQRDAHHRSVLAPSQVAGREGRLVAQLLDRGGSPPGRRHTRVDRSLSAPFPQEGAPPLRRRSLPLRTICARMEVELAVMPPDERSRSKGAVAADRRRGERDFRSGLGAVVDDGRIAAAADHGEGPMSGATSIVAGGDVSNGSASSGVGAASTELARASMT